MSVLSPLKLLLVLDNCEHLIDAAGAFAEGIAKHPDLKIIDSQSGNFERSGGKQVMEAFLKKHGKAINVVYAHNDDMALGAAQAIEEAGKTLTRLGDWLVASTILWFIFGDGGNDWLVGGTGRDNVYGISARGIAMNTVDPGGEEFPHFVEFWIEKPAKGAKSIVVYALMEGPSSNTRRKGTQALQQYPWKR